jgi:hypothetical protein
MLGCDATKKKEQKHSESKNSKKKRGVSMGVQVVNVD